MGKQSPGERGDLGFSKGVIDGGSKGVEGDGEGTRSAENGQGQHQSNPAALDSSSRLVGDLGQARFQGGGRSEGGEGVRDPRQGDDDPDHIQVAMSSTSPDNVVVAYHPDGSQQVLMGRDGLRPTVTEVRHGSDGGDGVLLDGDEEDGSGANRRKNGVLGTGLMPSTSRRFPTNQGQPLELRGREGCVYPKNGNGGEPRLVTSTGGSNPGAHQVLGVLPRRANASESLQSPALSGAALMTSELQDGVPLCATQSKATKMVEAVDLTAQNKPTIYACLMNEALIWVLYLFNQSCDE